MNHFQYETDSMILAYLSGTPACLLGASSAWYCILTATFTFVQIMLF
jgi:hypothetical protein